MDYRSYRCGGMDIFKCLVASLAAGALLAWLFYRSAYAAVLSLPLFFICKKSYVKDRIEGRKDRLLLEFKDGMQAVSASLLAGYSMENAWREAEKELRELHGEGSYMVEEFHAMNSAVRMNRPLEQTLAEFAERSGCEDIESFAEVFTFAKRSGGDFAGIIRTTVQKMNGKIEVEREIATAIAGKRLEGRIMNMMPVFILLYLNCTSREFLDALYGNVLGILVMTGALAVYAVTIRLSGKIMDIKV